MIDTELFPFMDTFRSLQRVFPLRGEDHELRDVGASYFKAFRRFPLKEIQAGAERWIEQGKRFPKPAEWIDCIPRLQQTVDAPIMSDDDARTYARAEGLGYEDAPCHCTECREAEVHEKPLRFVPEITASGGNRIVKDALRDRTVTAGHWAHGWELFRWYDARANFYNRCLELGLRGNVLEPPTKRRRDFHKRLEAIYQKPEAE